jgi:hypothetical protein
MPVLSEAISIIIKDSSIDERFTGGRDHFLQTLPNNTHCSDQEIHRVGFMNPQDAELYISYLEQNGLVWLQDKICGDFVVVDMIQGPTTDCPWIGFARKPFFAALTAYVHTDEDFSIAWLKKGSAEEGIPLNHMLELTIAVPMNWTPDNALYTRNFVRTEEAESRLLEISDSNGIKKYIDAGTGDIVYSGHL